MVKARQISCKLRRLCDGEYYWMLSSFKGAISRYEEKSSMWYVDNIIRSHDDLYVWECSPINAAMKMTWTNCSYVIPNIFQFPTPSGSMTTATKNNTSAIPKAATKLVWIFDRSELMLLKRERGSRTGDLKHGNWWS